MPLVIYNNAYATLASNVLVGDPTISLAAGQGARFPLTSGQWTYATLIKADGTLEIVKVTARAVDVLSVTRAQDGTAASAFSSGDRIECRPVAAEMNDILADGIDNSRKVVLAGTDTYTGTLSPAITAYSNLAYLLQFPNANTVTAPTVNLNGLGAKVVKNRDGAALVAGQIKAGSWHVGYYDGTNFNLVTLPTESAGASLVLLATPVLAAGTLDQNSIFSTTYDCFELTFTDVTVSNNGVELWLRISQGGATRSGAADYAHVRTAADSTPAVAAAGASADSKIVLAAGISNTAGVALSGKVWFFGPAGTTTQKRINSKLSYTSNTPALVNVDGAGCYVGTTSGSPLGALDGFHLSASAGTITGGSFTLHALKKT